MSNSFFFIAGAFIDNAFTPASAPRLAELSIVQIRTFSIAAAFACREGEKHSAPRSPFRIMATRPFGDVTPFLFAIPIVAVPSTTP